MRQRPKRIESRGLGINLTPMIDVVFLLLIFFVLIAQFSWEERAEIRLPEPKPSAAKYIYSPDVLTVTVICDPQGELLGYQSEGQLIQPGQITILAEKLVERKRTNPQVQVNLRADRRADSRIIELLMVACGQAGISQVNLVAAMDRK